MFDNIQPIDLVKQRRRRYAVVGVIIAILLSGILYYEFKNYPEERQVKRFFQALEQKDYQAAYQIWQPMPSYKFTDFSQDWGPDGVQGPINDYKITGSRERGSGVVVRVLVNNKDTVSLWVEKKDMSLSFPPF